MANQAKFNGLGRLINDPKTGQTKSGSVSVSFTVSCTTTTRDKDNRYYESDLYNVVAYGKLAENAAQRLQKGTIVYLTGPMKQNRYTTKTGQPGFSMEVTADDIHVAANQKEAPTRNNDDDFMP